MRDFRSSSLARVKCGQLLAIFLVAFCLFVPGLTGCSGTDGAGSLAGSSKVVKTESAEPSHSESEPAGSAASAASDGERTFHPSASFDLSEIPEYSGSPYAVVADGVPGLSEEDAQGVAECYAPLDALGRCGTAVAVVSRATQPTEERGSIGMVKPSGWHTVRYDDLVEGKYLYNRCHLIGYQLTGENANERNLITGTRYMNVDGMLPFEDQVDGYVDSTGGSVLYRVTPLFAGDELVARGVHMEALSLGDGGVGLRFNVFCYNVQPGIEIDYATGESHIAETQAFAGQSLESSPSATYVLNANTNKFHLPGCSSVSRMKESNRREFTGTREELIAQGYEPCSKCNP